MQNLTASEYKQFDCLGTVSKIGKRKREFVSRGAEVKLRLIVYCVRAHACTCGAISYLYRNKLDVADVIIIIEVFCHTEVVAPMVTRIYFLIFSPDRFNFSMSSEIGSNFFNLVGTLTILLKLN